MENKFLNTVAPQFPQFLTTFTIIGIQQTQIKFALRLKWCFFMFFDIKTEHNPEVESEFKFGLIVYRKAQRELSYEEKNQQSMIMTTAAFMVNFRRQCCCSNAKETASIQQHFLGFESDASYPSKNLHSNKSIEC